MSVGAGKVKLDCETCQKLRNPDSFEKGSRVRISAASDCENCELFKTQPIDDNENIIELYNSLPSNYSDLSGLRRISATDIKFLLELFEVPSELWYDYYQRITFFHDNLLSYDDKNRKKKTERDKSTEAWKAQKRKSFRTH